MTVTVARPVPAALLLAEMRAVGISHVLCVPDSHQRSLIDVLEQEETPRLVRVCTEDEAIAINAGLWLGGQRPLVLVQSTGFYASMNALKGFGLDARIPTVLLIGVLGREPDKTSRESAMSFARLLEPTLETWNIAYERLEGPEDVSCLARAYRAAEADRAPVAVLVGVPTS